MGSAVRLELHRLADQIDDDHIEAAVDYLRLLVQDDHTSTASSLISNTVSPSENDPPLWGIAGIGRSGEASDIAKNKDAYLADAFARKDG